ncbi:Spy/CpxP family protein refolding chaperone [Hydrogenimonas thermophila]|uniref:LTXXQ motif family protein n=1 Tax=Hydrogenimonas thermophila TaxID=223786 RepID=A0A1I5UDZ8_9BACT|nr:hypothetical protein [Hydrogenimonas thermophila]WOE69182.1 hypothetical protein RZR91_08695 [Hydrogenimonas thermophila]WOE71692.1 hypothetical protein RZR97_08670 [Hydrogenimonas thermophila]SFP93493.1 hypothetical protein SAMN05216234_1604 [Hydrogenimonas thermophila]
MKFFLILFLSFNILLADHNDEEDLFEFHMPHDLSYLNLTRVQKEKILNILSRNNQRLKLLHQKKEIVESRIKKLFLQDNFNKEKLISILVELKKESIDIEVELFSELHKVLTPKQRVLFIDYIEEWEVE